MRIHGQKIIASILLASVVSAMPGCASARTHPSVPSDETSVQVSVRLPELVRFLRPGTLFVVDGVPEENPARVLALRPPDIAWIGLANASDCLQPQQGCPVLIINTRQGSHRP